MGLQVASLFGVLELVDKFTPGLKAAQKNTDEFGKGVGGAIEKINALSSAMSAVPGAAFLLGAVKAASDFDKTMTNVGSIMGKTKDQMGGISQEILNVGRNSVAGAQATAEAFTDIVGGVADASTHMAILNAAIATSEAGQASLQATTSGLVSVMNAYKFSADKASFASDVLTQTVGVGVGSMEQMVSAIAPISGLAASAGIKFNDMGAAIAFMTTKGQTAAQASTQYKAAIVALLNPNAQMTAAIKKTGAESGSAMIKQFGLVGALNKLKASVGGSQDAMAKMMGSVEALQAATALATDEFGDFGKSFQNGLTGATDAARQIQLTSFSAQFEIFKNNLIGVAIAAGNVLLPALGGLFSILNGLMGLINRFDPNLLGLVAAFTALGVVIPALLPLFGLLAGAIAPLLLPIAALTGAFAAVKLAWDTDFGGIRTSITQFWADIQPAIAEIKSGVETFFNILNAPTKMTLDTSGMSDSAARLTKKLNALDPSDGLTKEADIDFGTKLKSAIDAAWPIVQPAIQSLLDKSVALLKTLIPQLIAALVGLGQSIASAIGAQLAQVDWLGLAVGMWAKASALGQGILTNIGAALSNIGASISEKLSGINVLDIASQAGAFLGKALAFGGQVLTNIMSGLTNLYTDVTAKLSSIDAVDIGKQAANLLLNALKFGADLIGKLIDGLTGGGEKVKGKIGTETDGIDFAAISGKLLTAAFNFSVTLIGKLIEGLGSFASELIGKLGSELGKVDILAQAGKMLGDALSFAGTLIGNIVSGLGDLGTRLTGELSTRFGGIDLIGQAGKLLTAASELATRLINALVLGLADLPAKIIGKLSEGFNAVGDFVSGAVNKLLGRGDNPAGGAPAAPPVNKPLAGGVGVAANVPMNTGRAGSMDIPVPALKDDNKGTPTNPVVVTVQNPNGAMAGQQAQLQPPVQPPPVAPVAQAAAGQAGIAAAAGGQNPVEPIIQAAIAWLETTGKMLLTNAFKMAMDAGAAAFSAAGMAAIPSGVMAPLNLALMWLNTVGRAGVVTTFAALATAANGALKGVGSAMVSSVADALIRIATMIGNLPNGVGAQLAASIRAAAASGRARGGAIGAGMYLVGEHGPELIQLGAGQSGHVYENSLVRGAKGGGSGGNSGGIVLHNPVFQGVQDPESLLNQLEQVAGRYNMTVMQPR